ncbi:hypothetical protein RI129_000026 [Pyrocoelia pectoralis]|uniref:Carbonic anhydrase n=1 Tax=Pyrocoelia pectoralis TaxID=417401 RepID=A0AAN7Z5E3_9COLE
MLVRAQRESYRAVSLICLSHNLSSILFTVTVIGISNLHSSKCNLYMYLFLVHHNGSRQSPINIDIPDAPTRRALPLKWNYGYNSAPQKMYLTNTGHSLTLTVTHTEPLQLSSGTLSIPYKFEQLHFHWGENDGIGSEHLVNGFQYPMEMHLVHSQNVRKDIDNLAVVAFLFRVMPTPNPALQALVDAASCLKDPTKLQEEVTPFALTELLPDWDYSYFTYNGSLTTPPYTESVTWIISAILLDISRSQLEVFREVAKAHKDLKNNYRCVQNINQRLVDFVQVYSDKYN